MSAKPGREIPHKRNKLVNFCYQALLHTLLMRFAQVIADQAAVAYRNRHCHQAGNKVQYLLLVRVEGVPATALLSFQNSLM